MNREKWERMVRNMGIVLDLVQIVLNVIVIVMLVKMKAE